MNELENTLSKLLVTNSPTRYVLLLDDVWRLSGAWRRGISPPPP